MEHVSENDTYSLTVAGGLVALLVAVGLAFLFYYLVGYPLNVPLALGAAVFVVELLDGVVRYRMKAADIAGAAAIHALLATGAAWLGTVIVGLVG